MSNQTAAQELAIRQETADVISTIMDGNRSLIPVRFYHNVSHWKSGDRPNHVEYVVWCLMELPMDAAGYLLTYLESKYLARLDEVIDADDLHRLRLDALEADHEEDVAAYLAAHDPKNARLHYDRLLRERAAKTRVLRLYERLHGPKAHVPPDQWPKHEKDRRVS